MQGNEMSVYVVAAFVVILAVVVCHRLNAHRREIGELWDVLFDISGAMHDHDEALRHAAERLRKLEDDGK